MNSANPLIAAGMRVFAASVAMLLVDSAWAHSPHDEIEFFALSANFEADATMFVMVRDLLLRSPDGGQSWQRIVNGLDIFSDIKAIATSPQAGSREVFLGTEGDGVYLSRDGGDSWTRQTGGLDGLTITAVEPLGGGKALAAVRYHGVYLFDGSAWRKVLDAPGPEPMVTFASHSAAPGKVYLAAPGGILLRSEDGGETWAEAGRLPGEITAMAMSPDFARDQSLFVAAGQGLFRFTGGSRLFAKLEPGPGGRQIVSVAFSPSYADDGMVFAAAWREGVYRSTDRGETWTLSDRGLTRNEQADQRGRPHFIDLRVSAGFASQGRLYLSGYDGLFVSEDRGVSWREIETLAYGLPISMDVATGSKGAPEIVVSTYWLGAFHSADLGVSWQGLNSGYDAESGKISRLHGVFFSPNYAQDNRIFAGKLNQLMVTENRGVTWHTVDLKALAGDDDVIVDRAVFSPEFGEDRTLYIGGRVGRYETRRSGVFKSVDGGQSFEPCLEIENEYVQSMVISPGYVRDGTVLISTGRGAPSKIMKTADAGRTWREVTGAVVFDHLEGGALAISPDFERDGLVWIGTSAGLFRSTDKGETWLKAGGLPAARPFVETIAVSPDFEADRLVILALRGLGLFRSRDGSESFTPFAAGLSSQNISFTKPWHYSPPEAIRFSPGFSSDGTVFGLTASEVYSSFDRGHSWASSKLPKGVARAKPPQSHTKPKDSGNGTIDFPYVLATMIVLGIWLIWRSHIRRRAPPR